MPDWADANFAAICTAAASALIAGLALLLTWNQVRLQARTARLEAFAWIVERMEATREERAVLYEFIRARSTALAAMPDDSIRESADKVCRAFDTLGLLDRTGYVDRRLVSEFYAVPLVNLYEDYLRDFIANEQVVRGEAHFWEVGLLYKRLATFARKHPTATGHAEWES